MLRGASKDILNEVERNLQDAMNVTRNVMVDARLVPGGGAVEMALAHVSSVCYVIQCTAINRFLCRIEHCLLHSVAINDPGFCQSVTCIRYAKMAERINVVFVVEISGDPRNIVLDRGPAFVESF